MSASNPAPTVLSVVVPVYREASHLAQTVEQLLRVLQPLDLAHEVVLVDDGSTDDTWACVTALAAAQPAVRGLRLSRNFGKEAAISAGLETARGQAVVVMDGDLQHPPALIPQLVARWRQGADIVEGVKEFRGQESALGRLQARLFHVAFRRLSGYDLQGASDFKLLDRRVVEAWKRMGERALFFRGMSVWLGFRREQLPFSVAERAGGGTQWTFLRLLRLAVDALTSYSSAPLQLVTLLGAAFWIFALVLGAQTLFNKLSGHAVDGFTTVILLLLIVGAVMMFALGIIGAYVARIYEEVKGRPRYIVAERTDGLGG